MAKSLRSKWKRKMKAIKRVRYGKKELDRLKLMIANAESNGTPEVKQEETKDVDMDVISKVLPENQDQRGRSRSRSNTKKSNDIVNIDEENQMDTEDAVIEDEEMKTQRVYNKKTMKDQYGNYPVWMNIRKIISKKKKGKRLKMKKKHPGQKKT